jgi:polyribonucleotide nucleotidyltransferase
MRNIKKYTAEFAGKTLTAEFSDLADQTNGSVLLRYGDTVVLATAVMSEVERQGIDYFPLVVDYEEKFYAAGQILGSRFIRREGRPSDEAILVSRLIDRAIRPLFNQKMRNEVQVTVLALSIDGENDPDIPALLAASLALGTSNIPWEGPIGAGRIGFPPPAGGFVINPAYAERENLTFEAVLASKDEKINMIEGQGKETPEELAAEAFEKCLEELKAIQKFQEEIISEIGKEKITFEIKSEPKEMRNLFKKHFEKRTEEALYSKDKSSRNIAISELKMEWLEAAKNEFGEKEKGTADEIFEQSLKETVHAKIIKEEKRPDGRKIDELRPLFSQVNILPRVHGSALFYRGGTHILSVVTLGAPTDVQLIEGMEIQTKKRFLHHYNFPPFSSGETGRMAGPGRREIGHGALAERALLAVIPEKDDFPYTIRIVSECLASNGSTSMGSVCASSLALMNAGVPIKAPVAGIAMGLMIRENDYKILTDIQGPEDHQGDMDCKIAGTKNGVTAIQMDVKIKGVVPKILKEILEQSLKARKQILENMEKTLAEPLKELPPQAPRIIKLTINPEKIREVIGPGGKTINKITEATGAEIDIEQNGTIFITGKNEKDATKAAEIVKEITHEYQVGEILKGIVTRIFDFGAMVEFAPKQEGLVHISELAPFRVDRVTDVVQTGDLIPVKIVSIDDLGRFNLSLKAVDPNYARRKSQQPIQPARPRPKIIRKRR